MLQCSKVQQQLSATPGEGLPPSSARAWFFRSQIVPTLLTAFRAASLIEHDYPRDQVIADVAEQTGLTVDEVTRQVDAGLKVRKLQPPAAPVEGCFCRPCQRHGECHGQPFLDSMRRAAELSVAGYIFGRSRNLDGLEAALKVCLPWHRHHLLDGNREGEIARRWEAGDTKNAIRMMVRP
jgi:hypothetical protein